MSRGRMKALVLGAMCFALFMTNLDATVVNIALPKIQMSLNSGVSGLQWIVNAYTLPLASLVLVSGTLGNLYGRKRVFQAGLVTFTIGSAICGFATSLWILLTGRVLQGIGAAALLPTSLSILTTTFPDPKEKAKALGVWSAVSGLALAAGPTLGGILVDSLGWQSVFFLNLPLGAFALGVTTKIVQETLNLKEQRFDRLGLVLGVFWLASLTYALIEGNTIGWRSAVIISLLIVCASSLLAFLVVESRCPYPMLPLSLFKNLTFVAVNVVAVLVFFTFFGLLFILSLFFQNIQGYSAIATGLRFVPLNGSFVIASLVSGWLATRLGWRSAIIIGLGIASVAMLCFLQINASTEYGAIAWNIVLCGIGAGLTLPSLTTAAMSTLPPAQTGIASAVINTSMRFGSVLGVALQGAILTLVLVSDLKRSLIAFGLSSTQIDRIIIDALHGGFQSSIAIPTSIKPFALHQAINNAFVSGLHATLIVASIALLAGIFLTLSFVKPTSVVLQKLVRDKNSV